MAKKKGTFRSVSLRMPAGTYGVLASVAQARGTDVSGLINSLLADRVPELADWLRRHHEALPGARLATLAALARDDPAVLDLIITSARDAGAQDLLADALAAREARHGEEGEP